MYCSAKNCSRRVYREGFCEEHYHEVMIRRQEKRINLDQVGKDETSERKRARAALRALQKEEEDRRALTKKKKPATAPKPASPQKPKKIEPMPPRRKRRPSAGRPIPVERVSPPEMQEAQTENAPPCLVIDCAKESSEMGLCKDCYYDLVYWSRYKDQLDRCPVTLTGSQVQTFRHHFAGFVPAISPGHAS